MPNLEKQLIGKLGIKSLLENTSIIVANKENTIKTRKTGSEWSSHQIQIKQIKAIKINKGRDAIIALHNKHD